MSPKILFFLSHQPNPRFIKQINFLSQRNITYLWYFHRNYLPNLEKHYSKKCKEVKSFGKISNKKYFVRVLTYLFYLKDIRKELNKNEFDKVIVNNLDNLAILKLLLWLKKNKPSITLEISDLRAYKYKKNISSLVIRFFERKIIKKTDKLIITSPNYADYYKFLNSNNIFILENKILTIMMEKQLNKIQLKKNKTIRIGIVGLLLQDKMYRLLMEFVTNNNNFSLHIFGTAPNIIDFIEADKNFKNIYYYGDFDYFTDIKSIHNNIDILFAVYDNTNNNVNNSNALPNKLYDAIYFKTPIIAAKNTYLGNYVERLGIGLTIDLSHKESFNKIFSTIDFETYKSNFNSINENIYIGDNDYNLLEEFLR